MVQQTFDQLVLDPDSDVLVLYEKAVCGAIGVRCSDAKRALRWRWS